LSGRLMDDDFVSAIKKAKTTEEILNLIKE